MSHVLPSSASSCFTSGPGVLLELRCKIEDRGSHSRQTILAARPNLTEEPHHFPETQGSHVGLAKEESLPGLPCHSGRLSLGPHSTSPIAPATYSSLPQVSVGHEPPGRGRQER